MQISAKDLGWIEMEDFCPRCFWVERHYKLPFQIGFPGIFSSIDSYTKNVVSKYFERYGRLDHFDELTSKHTTIEGFEMPFTSNIHKIRKNTKEIDRLMEKANKIYEMAVPPKGRDGCEDCKRLDALLAMPKYI